MTELTLVFAYDMCMCMDMCGLWVCLHARDVYSYHTRYYVKHLKGVLGA